jgi:hypothetical protein
VCTFVELGWPPQLENGKLLCAAETAEFDVLVTSDQNIRYQQNLTGRRLALVVLGSNIWPLVREHAIEIAEKVDAATGAAINSLKFRYRRSVAMILAKYQNNARRRIQRRWSESWDTAAH